MTGDRGLWWGAITVAGCLTAALAILWWIARSDLADTRARMYAGRWPHADAEGEPFPADQIDEVIG